MVNNYYICKRFLINIIMTLREIVYLISDELKLMSDDSYFNEDHIKFLVNKYRVFLLNQQYSKDVRKAIPESNYQTIKLNLKQVSSVEDCPCSEYYLKSEEEIPHTLPFSMNKAYSTINDYRITFVSKERFKYTSFNRWTKNIIYATNIDGHIYLTSNNPQFFYLEELNFKGIFEDVEKVSSLNEDYCDILDIEYPLEEGLVPLLIQSVVQELSPKTITPEDSYNNASDDKSNLANYIARNQKQNPR